MVSENEFKHNLSNTIRKVEKRNKSIQRRPNSKIYAAIHRSVCHVLTSKEFEDEKSNARKNRLTSKMQKRRFNRRKSNNRISGRRKK